MKQKTVKMSTRKGNTVLLQDVIDRSCGEVVFTQMQNDQAKHSVMALMIGSFFRKLAEAHEEGKDVVTFKISDYLEERKG